MPADARDKALSELKRLRNLQPMSSEASVIKTYLDELLSMPWSKSDKFEIDLTAARAELDRDHAGMNDVKERILEHLAVMKKTGNTHGTILCFVGAPGVGKTSLGKSVARALGRKYQRISLGGVSDEAHFRGHRKTYIGSQPGRIMDALKRAGANNPVIVLDEIDKLGRDYRGDPESALLEVLDPEQNRTFRDHYLEVDFDLSKVLFIATANSLNISPALRDRMEIIELPSYSEDEKLQIARGHLIRRAAADTGWRTDDIVISDAALRHLIQRYTAESGVRDLQRKLTAMLRKQLLKNDGADVATEFTDKDIDAMLSATKNFGFNRKIGFNA
jgi:ATP-dependent Lon protease